MGLFGSLIKSAVKTVALPMAAGLDIASGGAFFFLSDDGSLTEQVGRSLGKDLKKISKGLDKL